MSKIKALLNNIMQNNTQNLNEFSQSLRQLIETKQKDMMLKARENPAVAATKAARGRSAEEVHGTIMKALESGKVVTVPTRTVADFEAPAVDHHLVMHQGRMMLVSPKGRGREVHMLSPSDTGHIRVHFKEKGRRAAKPVYLHGGFQGSGDVIESDPAYRVSLVGGVPQFRGLPDMSEETNHESDKVRIMNLLEERLNKKKIGDVVKGVAGGLALAGAVIGGHQALLKTKPMMQQVTPAVAKIGSGQVKAQVKTEQPVSRAHEIAAPVIREREGFESKAYNKDGKWTVGYGTTTYSTGKPVQPGDTISREQAEKEHEHHVQNVVIPNLEKKIPHWDKMNDNQKASVISFSYNVGEHFYGNKNFETVTNALSHPDNWHKVPQAMAKYTRATNMKTGKKEILPGLVTRRKMEGELWSKPVN